MKHIVKYCWIRKGKQTYPPPPSLENQLLRHVHSIAYNNIYYLTLCGKRIAITTRVYIHERDDDNNSSSKNARNKSKHHYMFGGVSYAE